MKAVVTVVGKDRVGIIAGVCNALASFNVNILDISQTIMQDYFVMIMLIDFEKSDIPFDELQKGLRAEGESRNVVIRVQREDIFQAMHRWMATS